MNYPVYKVLTQSSLEFKIDLYYSSSIIDPTISILDRKLPT